MCFEYVLKGSQFKVTAEWLGIDSNKVLPWRYVGMEQKQIVILILLFLSFVFAIHIPQSDSIAPMFLAKR